MFPPYQRNKSLLISRPIPSHSKIAPLDNSGPSQKHHQNRRDDIAALVAQPDLVFPGGKGIVVFLKQQLFVEFISPIGPLAKVSTVPGKPDLLIIFPSRGEKRENEIPQCPHRWGFINYCETGRRRIRHKPPHNLQRFHILSFVCFYLFFSEVPTPFYSFSSYFFLCQQTLWKAGGRAAPPLRSFGYSRTRMRAEAVLPPFPQTHKRDVTKPII